MGADPKPARLGRDEIIEAALVIADRDGLVGLSMHGVAKALGVGTMTLYTYVDGKDDLLDGMTDRVLSLVELPTRGTWDERIRAAMLATRDVAEVHPSFAGLIMTRAPATEVKRARHDHTTEQLLRAGLTQDDADRAALMLWGLIGGLLLGKRTGVFSAADVALGRERYAKEEIGCEIEFALDVVLDGLRARVRRTEEAGKVGAVM